MPVTQIFYVLNWDNYINLPVNWVGMHICTFSGVRKTDIRLAIWIHCIVFYQWVPVICLIPFLAYSIGGGLLTSSWLSLYCIYIAFLTYLADGQGLSLMEDSFCQTAPALHTLTGIFFSWYFLQTVLCDANGCHFMYLFMVTLFPRMLRFVHIYRT